MRRLLYIAFAFSIHTQKWVRYFRDLGDEVMLVSFYRGPEIPGVKLVCLPGRWRFNPLLKINKVRRLIAEFRPQIVHAHYASSCGLVSAMTGFHPYVLSVWGDDIMEFPKKSPLHRLAVKKAVLYADRVTATSKFLAEKTAALLARDIAIEVIPFGVDLEQFKYRLRPPRSEVVIGTVRHLTPKYGIDNLIRAFAALKKAYSNLRLKIVGDGPLRKSLVELAESSGVAGSVDFVGRITNEKVAQELAEFDIFVIPSVGEGEVFGVAAVEAMATGLPVVASAIGGLPEVVDDGRTGKLVKPADIKDLISAIEFYILRPEERIKHGLEGRRRVEHLYDWRQNAQQMDLLYRSIIGR